MKRLNHALLALTSFIAISCYKDATANYQVIPLPQEVVINQEGIFPLSPATKILYPDGNELLKRDAEFLSAYVKDATGQELVIAPANPQDTPQNAILLGINDTIEQEEGYELKVTPQLVTIQGKTPNGVFYGIQTLRKSIPAIASPTSIALPAVEIKDYPRFAYRGMHLDVGRHFFPTEFVKKHIDLLALHNMNTFHWHLTEDQGWRIEIKKYPKLTEIGSQRSETVIGHNSGKYDGQPHGGFYTQEEIKDVVAYAKERYITIIPEFDLPGHMLAVLASYPELGCTGGPYEVEKTWGVFEDVLCVGNEKSMQFLEDVMTEIIEMFPSDYIHIGGDEAPRNRWAKCPKCQARIKAEKLKADNKHTAEDRLQSYCMSRIEKFLNSKGRRIIGWDEILEGDVAPNATVMSWRGMEGGIEAAQLGHDVIMTPNTYLYFDYYQTPDTKNEPDAIGGCLTLDHVYSLEPVPAKLSDTENKHIIGVQANLWSEYIQTTQQVEYMVLPRMAALAEVQWTMPEQKNFNEFAKRLFSLMKIYQRDSLNYAKHIFDIKPNLSYNPDQKAIMIELNTIDVTPIYYTLDGTEPLVSSNLYKEPVAITSSAEFKAIAIRPVGNSKVLSENISFNKATGCPIELVNQPAPKYTYNGATTLVDGLKGSGNYAGGRWLGFQGTDVEAIINLGSPTEIKEVSTEACIDVNSWIMGITGLSVAISEDGKNFKEVAAPLNFPTLTDLNKKEIMPYMIEFAPTKATYVKVTIKCTPALPKGHTGEGKPAFMFIDEICIN